MDQKKIQEIRDRIDQLNRKLQANHEAFIKKIHKLNECKQELEDEIFNDILNQMKEKYLCKAIKVVSPFGTKYYFIVDIQKEYSVEQCNFKLTGRLVSDYNNGSINLESPNELEDIYPVECTELNYELATKDELLELKAKMNKTFDTIFSGLLN